LKLASSECGYSRVREPLLDQVIAVSHVLIADEAEEMIDDATAGGRDMDLLEVHEEMLGGSFSYVHEVKLA